MRDHSTAGSGYALGIVVGVVIATLIMAMLIRLAVSLANRIVGKSGATIPEPSLGSAMGIAFLTTIANSVAGLAVNVLIHADPGIGKTNPAANLAALSAPVPLGMLIMAGLLALALPTTFGRALFVAFIQCLIYLVLTATLLVTVYLVLGPTKF